MKTVSVEQLARFIGQGTSVHGDPGTPVRGVSTDSRTIGPGQLFVALVGDRFDGHQFVEAAVARGAAAVVADPARLPEPVRRRWLDGGGEGHLPPLIAVEDTLAALQAAAAGYAGWLGVTVVAVTGSTGKTTTKDMLAAVLGGWQPTIKSRDNQNNDIGVPLTLFQAEADTRFAVVEMGMRGPGEVARLCRVARPTVGVITNVGPVHVGRLGSVEAVAAAKAELVASLPAEGAAVLNGDNPWCRRMAAMSAAPVLWYGRARDAAVRLLAVESRGFEGIEVEVGLAWPQGVPGGPGRGAPGQERLRVPIPGRHNGHNAAAAATAALRLGCPWEAVVAGLARVDEARTGMRMEVVRLGGITLIDDAYNASPPSMGAALATLAEVDGGRKVAVLGDMLELGDYAPDAHRHVGRWAAEAGVDVLIAVGQWAETVLEGAREAGFRGEATAAADAAGGAAAASAVVRPGDICLVKGSRGVHLEHVVASLKERARQRAAGEGAGR